MKLKRLLNALKKLINLLDNPIDNLKHWLYRDRKIKGNWWYRIKVPMANKGYYGIELAVYKKQQPAADRKI